jgi:hypothetical protein
MFKTYCRYSIKVQSTVCTALGKLVVQLRIFLHKYVRYANIYSFVAQMCSYDVLFKSPNMIVLAISIPKWDDARRLCAYTVQHKVQQTLGKQKLGVHPGPGRL